MHNSCKEGIGYAEGYSVGQTNLGGYLKGFFWISVMIYCMFVDVGSLDAI